MVGDRRARVGVSGERSVERESEARPRLIVIESTDVTIADCTSKGYWSRQRAMLAEYAKQFDVLYYTSDAQRMQHAMPPNAVHKVSRLATDVYGLRHLVFYLYLVLQAFSWRGGGPALIRLLGVTLPVVPLVKRISGRKVVLTFHYDWARQTQKNYRRNVKVYTSSAIQRASLRAADHVICTMDWLQRVAREEYGHTSTSIVPNFVDTELFRPAPQKKPHVVFVGRLHWSKGADLLIEAFHRLHLEWPDARLVILGSGEERARLETLAAGAAYIELKGSVQYAEVAACLAEAKIFVLPTRTMEGHPRALVEAMTAGCICIASSVAGNREVLTESGSADLLFRADDRDDLLAKLSYARSYRSTAQREFALEHYASGVLFERETELIKDTLREGRSSWT